MAALAAVAKAALPSSTRAEVVLGAKQYLITRHLFVPAGTSIKGAGSDATTLSFTLGPPERGEPSAAFEMSSNTSLSNFSVVITENTTHAKLVVVDFSGGKRGLVASGLSVIMRQTKVGMAFQMESVADFEVRDNNLSQIGACDRTEARVLFMHDSQHGTIAGNHIQWNCAAISADISDNVVVEDNKFECIATGAINGGT